MNPLKKPVRVILHCADTQDDEKDIFGVKEIKEWHLKRGFSDIGYHYVIRRTGLIEIGRSTLFEGAHTEGENHNSLGVCYIGRQNPTHGQFASIVELSKKIQEDFGIEPSQWFGHYEFNQTKFCPGLNMVLFRKWLVLAS